MGEGVCIRIICVLSPQISIFTVELQHLCCCHKESGSGNVAVWPCCMRVFQVSEREEQCETQKQWLYRQGTTGWRRRWFAQTACSPYHTAGLEEVSQASRESKTCRWTWLWVTFLEWHFSPLFQHQKSLCDEHALPNFHNTVLVEI